MIVGGGDINSFYTVEGLSVCDVVGAAGLLSADTTVHRPNHAQVGCLCGGDRGIGTRRKTLGTRLNEASPDRPKLGWNDLLGGMHGSKREVGDRTLQGRVKNMFAEFMYDEDSIPLQYKPTMQSDSSSEL